MKVRTLVACLACVFALAAHGEVQRLEVTSVGPFAGGKSFGASGAYEKLVGRVYFEADPSKSGNRAIADLSLAPQNDRGLVAFSADFVVLRPVDGEKARRGVLLEIPSHGATQANGWLFTASRGSRFSLPDLKDVTLEDAFAFEQGFTLAWVGWQFDLPAGSLAIKVPTAPTHGSVRASILLKGREARREVFSLAKPPFYCAADDLQPKAVLTVKEHFDAPARVLPRSTWSFASDASGALTPDSCSVYYKTGFERGKLYDLVYDGVSPPMAGLGLAAVRDFAAFLKYGAERNDTGAELRKNPQTLKPILGFGSSQAARFLREFVYRGFNADERGRRAFDGLFVASAGAGRGSFDQRYAMPDEAENSVLSALRPVDLFPFSDDIETDPLTHAKGGLLLAAERAGTLPKIFYSYSSTDFWARAGSLAVTSVDGAQELPLNPSSRLYFIAGTADTHGPFPPVKVRKAPPAIFAYLANFATPSWAFRALLIDLYEWVDKDAPPPASVYPRLPQGLVVRQQVNFPKIPETDFPAYVPMNWRMDFGPDFAKRGVITVDPPKLGPAYQILLPQVDQDGIDEGGIRLPEVAVPLGTFLGWNYELPTLPDFQYLGGLVGSFVPFAKTRDDRRASADPRASIEERYGSREEYLKKVRAAAQALIARHLMRAEDLDAATAMSAEQWDRFAKK